MESHHTYESVHDEREDSRSSTEVESLMEDAKPWRVESLERPVGRSRRSRVRSFFARHRWIIDTTLLVAILGLLLRDQLRKPALNPWDFNGDLTGFGPRFSQQIKTFAVDQKYAPYNTSEFFKPEVAEAWNELMPYGMGFQWVKNPEKYHDLPTPIEWTDNMTVFTTSMTHQLHCLYAIVQTYSGLKSDHELPDDHHWHMIHCFDYLRQTIMCCGDTALEGLETTFPDHNGGSDGWDSKHVCKDYNQVINYLEDVRAYDDRQIW